MSIGAYRDFIRIRPVDPENDHMATVDVNHIIGWRVYTTDVNTRRTKLMLSTGEYIISNESIREFEQRLKFIKPHLVINE